MKAGENLCDRKVSEVDDVLVRTLPPSSGRPRAPLSAEELYVVLHGLYGISKGGFSDFA
jgi:hypothetical protein